MWWCRNYGGFSKGVVVALWTVIQTSFHIIWALCGYYFYICKIRPGHYVLVVLYLTYFYNQQCGEITLDDDNIITKNTNKNSISFYGTDEDAENISDVIQEILDKAVLPNESSAAYRTQVYFHVFIVSDAIWIISAFLLFAGTCFQIKKCLSLVFYCPWLIVTACVILLDVVSAVHFGLDILQVHSITTWLKFIGVQNYEEFSDLNSRSFSTIIPLIPAIFLCVLFSRILVFWILNIVHFFQIMHVAVLAYQDNLDGRNSLRQQKDLRKRSDKSGLGLDTSAARIRNWQLFYGATETTSTESGPSSKNSERDCNSNTSSSRPSKESVKRQGDGLTEATYHHRSDSLGSFAGYISSDGNEPIKNGANNTSSYYRGYPDVADDIDKDVERKISVAGSLRGYLPWTYLPASMEEYTEKGQESNAPVCDYDCHKAADQPYRNTQTALK
ncbi:hypothetical protein NQ318_016758 [Aromia moschata]|uniref:Uncharacterized protein n=1 Tax=Aromia moschata TaxID=1265417 RepID=A0AAV8Y4S6_9CUCU|nr:hypothetical protein NQ318_016758 [Aromia moschata]